jgi:hypothetical protein
MQSGCTYATWPKMPTVFSQPALVVVPAPPSGPRSRATPSKNGSHLARLAPEM